MAWQILEKEVANNPNLEKIGIAEGVALGRGEGMALGVEKGVAIGEARGVAIGETKGILQTARKMKGKGFNIAVICEITGLPESEVQAL